MFVSMDCTRGVTVRARLYVVPVCSHILPMVLVQLLSCAMHCLTQSPSPGHSSTLRQEVFSKGSLLLCLSPKEL